MTRSPDLMPQRLYLLTDDDLAQVYRAALRLDSPLLGLLIENIWWYRNMLYSTEALLDHERSKRPE